VRFRLLDGVGLSIDGQEIELGHAKQRCLLAVLLVEANRPVSTDRLLDFAWGNRAPWPPLVGWH
jgi:DNA-binding SARP family transcriptional activator